MPLFGRKSKEQLVVPHGGEHHAAPTPYEAPVYTPEQQPQVEQQPRPIERKQPAAEVPKPGASTAAAQPQQPAAVPVQAKTPARQNIESVLSGGLTEVYQSMTPEEQLKFRIAGEEAATKLEGLMTGFRATARVVLDIIRDWLKLIPRVNKYFLEQESKIKTDEMLALQRKLKKAQKDTHIR